MTGFTDRIVIDDVEDQVVGAIVDDLVRLVRFEEKCIGSFDLDRAAVVALDAASGDDVIELPLRAVGMIGAQ
jgi:hypothetical protein